MDSRTEQVIGAYERIIPLGLCIDDPRGAIQNILVDDRMNHIALISSRAGTVRGNHYHPTDRQYIYVLTGSLESYSVPVSGRTGDVRRITVPAGELLYCPPMVAHAYLFLSDCQFLNIDCDPRDPARYAEHTIPYEVWKS